MFFHFLTSLSTSTSNIIGSRLLRHIDKGLSQRIGQPYGTARDITEGNLLGSVCFEYQHAHIIERTGIGLIHNLEHAHICHSHGKK